MIRKSFFFTVLAALFSSSLIHAQDSSELHASLPQSTDATNDIAGQRQYQDFIVKGLTFMEQRDYAKARQCLEEAKVLAPQEPEAYVNLAVLDVQTDEPENAIGLLEQAQSLAYPGYTNMDVIYYNLGLSYQATGNYKKALPWFEKTLSANPKNAQAMYSLGVCEHILGFTEKARAHIAQACVLFEEQKSPLLPVAQGTQALIAQSGSQQGSLLAGTLLTLASQAAKDNDLDQAILAAKKSILMDPRNAEAYYRLGVMYTQKEKFARAVSFFQHAIETDPGLAKAYLNLGGVYGKLKQYPEALKALDAALELDEDNPKIHYNIGMVYAMTGKRDLAKEHFEKAKSLCDETGDAAFMEKIDEVAKKL